MASRKQKLASSKKRHLAKAGKQIKWAPFWAVIKKYGAGKKIHPSRMTHVKRKWNRTSLKVKPRKMAKKHLG